MAPLGMADTLKAISFDRDGTPWDFEGGPKGSATPLNVGMMIAIRDRVHDELRGKVTGQNTDAVVAVARAISFVSPPPAMRRRLISPAYRHATTSGRSQGCVQSPRSERMELTDDYARTLANEFADVIRLI